MKLQLPSRRVIDLAPNGRPRPRRRAKGDGDADDPPPLFAEVRALVDAGDVALRDANGPVRPGDLALADYHALRAILTRLGWIEEDEVTIDCRNCGAAIAHRPCAALPLAPFKGRELDDPELDATLPFDVPHDVPGLGAVTLAPRTADEALPLHAALARAPLVVTPAVVRGMGVARVGDEARPHQLARRLSRASDDAWDALGDLFVRAHYPPRLFSIAPCPACGARNDVDAPYDREFEPSGESRNSGASNAESGALASAEPFPSLDAFDAAARAEMARALSDAGVDGITLVVEGGIAACDDGGEPLLGSYLPGYAGDPTSPSRSPEITVFHRTFRAMWDEDGPYDWRAELRETIEHELEHHLAYLAGDDPMDDEERAEIAREAARVHGRREVVAREIRAMNADIAGFVRRTWPIWLLLLVAVVLATFAEVR